MTGRAAAAATVIRSAGRANGQRRPSERQRKHNGPRRLCSARFARPPSRPAGLANGRTVERARAVERWTGAASQSTEQRLVDRARRGSALWRGDGGKERWRRQVKRAREGATGGLGWLRQSCERSGPQLLLARPLFHGLTARCQLAQAQSRARRSRGPRGAGAVRARASGGRDCARQGLDEAGGRFACASYTSRTSCTSAARGPSGSRRGSQVAEQPVVGAAETRRRHLGRAGPDLSASN